MDATDRRCDKRTCQRANPAPPARRWRRCQRPQLDPGHRSCRGRGAHNSRVTGVQLERHHGAASGGLHRRSRPCARFARRRSGCRRNHNTRLRRADQCRLQLAKTQPLAPLVALLLERGADPQRETSYGESALRVASGFVSFDVVKLLLDAGADREQLGWNSLIEAVVFGSLDDVRAALAVGADLETRDSAGRTALHIAVQGGDLSKAQTLRTAGAALATGNNETSPLTFAIQPSRPQLLAWLLAEGCDPNAPDRWEQTPLMLAAQVGAVEAVSQLLVAGASIDAVDQFKNTPLALAEDVEIVRLLVAAGADLNFATDTGRKALFGLPPEVPLDVSREHYLAAKSRCFGQANPEILAEPFWHAMIRSRAGAYTARTTFDDTSSYGEPVWCFQRFGRTLTALPDGRYVEVGGEHEDYYDPDFCIYNDVVVYGGNGAITLYGYPAEVFPPTDFHTATLVGDSIYLIGSLGYQGQRRVGETPVYRLSCATWAIERVQTSGRTPGWISRHVARYDLASHQIVIHGGKRSVANAVGAEAYVDNSETFTLDLNSLEWC